MRQGVSEAPGAAVAVSVFVVGSWFGLGSGGALEILLVALVAMGTGAAVGWHKREDVEWEKQETSRLQEELTAIQEESELLREEVDRLRAGVWYLGAGPDDPLSYGQEETELDPLPWDTDEE